MPDIEVDVLTDATPPEVVTLKGTTKLPITSMNVTSAVQLVEEDLLITGLGDEVIPVIQYTAAVRNLDPQIVQNGTDSDIEFDLFANGELVEDYDPDNWNLSIETDNSGGASFGGPNDDDLTVGPNVGSVTIRATYASAIDPTHDGNGITVVATTNVVAAVTNLLELYGPPNEVIEDTSYQLFARSRDGVTMEVTNDPEPGVTYAVTAGPATITGTNSDILTVAADVVSPPQTVTVTANKDGFTGDSVNYAAIEPPPWPNNEPPGMTPIEDDIDGSTKAFAGWTPDSSWNDNNRVVVVTDASAKFASSAIEKRFSSGDEGWNGQTFRNFGGWTELYFRIVFLLSDNYQAGAGGALITYGSPGGSRKFSIRLSQGFSGRLAWTDWTTAVGEYVPVDGSGNLIAPVSRGIYHTVEIYHIASINGGDGSLRFGLDNVEYTTFEKSFAGTRLSLTNQTWQATSPNTDKRLGKIVEAFQQINFTKTVNDHVRLSELYFSGKS